MEFKKFTIMVVVCCDCALFQLVHAIFKDHCAIIDMDSVTGRMRKRLFTVFCEVYVGIRFFYCVFTMVLWYGKRIKKLDEHDKMTCTTREPQLSIFKDYPELMLIP